jgi:enediyne biosynthesis protein E4
MRPFIQRHAAKVATGCMVLMFYLLAATGDHSADNVSALAARFRFETVELAPASNGQPLRTIREVHPALAHMRAWISAVGAGVAFADIADTGHPADICLVDPRNDSVTVMPAPGTGARFEPFALPTPSAGYDRRTIAPMGCLPADVNEDGKLDLVVYYWGRTPIVFLQVGTGVLSAARFKPVEVVGSRERWYTNAALFIDVDGDGHPDLVFGNYFRDGDRILDAAATDNVEMQHSMSRADNGGHKHLLLWQSASSDSVTFRDASAAFTAEMADGWTLALGAADLTGDLLPEIYVANDFGPDRLLLNKSTPGAPAFEIVEGRRDLWTPRSKVLGRDSFKGMGVDFGDVTGDGRLAIAVSNISEQYGLLESHFLFVPTGDNGAWARGVAPFRDESVRRGIWTGGWGWDIKFADLDNSSVPQILQAIGFIKGEVNRWPQLQELAMGNDELLKFPSVWPRFGPNDDISGTHRHDRLLVADQSGRYHDIWELLGLDHDTVSRGIAVADVYGDGRLAVAIARQWMPSIFLRNVSPNTGHWLELDLRRVGATAGTRAAIGASARIRLANGRILSAQIDGGSGHGGRRAPEIHFGLGLFEASTPDIDVEIAWRDAAGPHERTYRLAVDHRHLIVLDEAKLARADRPASDH